VCILFLTRCATPSDDSRQILSTPNVDPDSLPKTELPELDKSFCWSIHTSLGSVRLKQRFQQEIQLEKLFDFASHAKKEADRRNGIASVVQFEAFDFAMLQGINQVEQQGNFEVSYDSSKNLCKILGPQKPGSANRFQLRMHAIGQSGYAAHLDFLCDKFQSLEGCNHHCGFFYFEKGVKYNVFFGLRAMCQRYAYNVHNIETIMICDPDLKPILVCHFDDGKVSKQINLQYDENCKLLPSPVIDFSERMVSPFDLDTERVSVNSIFTFAMGNRDNKGDTLQPDNLNGLLWEDCYPVFWGHRGPVGAKKVLSPCE
jgi:hypothetical protein